MSDHKEWADRLVAAAVDPRRREQLEEARREQVERERAARGERVQRIADVLKARGVAPAHVKALGPFLADNLTPDEPITPAVMNWLGSSEGKAYLPGSPAGDGGGDRRERSPAPTGKPRRPSLADVAGFLEEKAFRSERR